MKLPNEVQFLAEKASLIGKKIYVVGGAVRDHLLGKEPKDFDLVTDMLPNQIEEFATSLGFKSLPIGKAFGIISIVGAHDTYEVATFRADPKGQTRNALQAQYGATIYEDAVRRDLTINALYWDIKEQTVIDLVGGVKDLKAKTIRAVGNAAERIEEDPIRALRAIRFKLRYDGVMDAGLFSAIHEAIPKIPSRVSANRIYQEFKQICKSASSGKALEKAISNYGLLDVVFGKLKPYTGLYTIHSDNPSPSMVLARMFPYGITADFKKIIKSEMCWGDDPIQLATIFINMPHYRDWIKNGTSENIIRECQRIKRFGNDVLLESGAHTPIIKAMLSLEMLPDANEFIRTKYPNATGVEVFNALQAHYREQLWRKYTALIGE